LTKLETWDGAASPPRAPRLDPQESKNGAKNAARRPNRHAQGNPPPARPSPPNPGKSKNRAKTARRLVGALSINN